MKIQVLQSRINPYKFLAWNHDLNVAIEPTKLQMKCF